VRIEGEKSNEEFTVFVEVMIVRDDISMARHEKFSFVL